MPHRSTHPGSHPRRRALGSWLLVAVLVAWPALLSAQEERTVTGSVTSAESLGPLVGVQITVKGTNIGTITGGEGNFSLRVPADATTLVFTSIGYRTVEVPIEDQVEVTLEQQAIQLEGLVVTALGIEREKRSLGYSVQDIQGADIVKVPELNVVNSLQGNVAGVRVTNAGPTGGTARVVIRGQSSITGDNQPLFIVDGVPIDNGSPMNEGFGGVDWGNRATDIDPSNIQSISVLKGPNAAALYGSRASSGAVVITTKSGAGTEGGGTGITATSSLTFEEPMRLPSYQNLYGQGFNGEFKWVDGDGAGVNDFADESWGPKLDGRPIDQFTGPQQPWVANPDNVSNFFETGTTLINNVSVARATDNANVRLSLTNTQTNGMAPGNTIDQLSGSLRGGASLTDRLSADASLTISNLQGDNRVGTGYDEDNPMQSFIWFGRQVDTDELRNYRCTGNEETPCNTENGQYNWNYNFHNNPYWEQLVNTSSDERDRLIGHVQASYELTDWITLTGRLARDWYSEERQVNTAFNSLDDAGDGGFTATTIDGSETNADLLVTATRQLTPDVSLNVTGGGNLRYNQFGWTDVQVDALNVPGLYTTANAGIPPNTTDWNAKKEVRSLYGSVNLNYGGYLNLDATGRNDWSSTLPEGNNSYFYPSVSGAFVFTDALGLQSSLLSSGKVRASWTRVGNDTEPYQLLSTYVAEQAWGSTPMYAVPDTLRNPDLKPEQTTSWEIGTDLGFFDERLGFVVTYYNTTTKDQIIPVATTATSGYNARILNAGEIQKKGWELLLRTTPIVTDQFRWDMTVNWAKNESEVVDLLEGVETIVIGGTDYWGLTVEARRGLPYGALIGNGYLRDDQGRMMLDEDGMPQIDPVTRVLGNYNPDWNGGIQNQFSYGPLELSVLVDGQMGGEIFSTTKWFGEYSGVLEETLRGRENDNCDPGIVLDGVLPDGSDNDKKICPQDFFHSNFNNHETGIIDASYVKLREVRLGYALPNSLMSRIGFSGGEVAVIGRNLFLWSEADHIDPETAFDASNRQGLEFGQFPTARSLGFSISVRP